MSHLSPSRIQATCHSGTCHSPLRRLALSVLFTTSTTTIATNSYQTTCTVPERTFNKRQHANARYRVESSHFTHYDNHQSGLLFHFCVLSLSPSLTKYYVKMSCDLPLQAFQTPIFLQHGTFHLKSKVVFRTEPIWELFLFFNAKNEIIHAIALVQLITGKKIIIPRLVRGGNYGFF